MTDVAALEPARGAATDVEQAARSHLFLLEQVAPLAEVVAAFPAAGR